MAESEDELERLRFDYEAAAGVSLPFATMEAATSMVAYFEDVAGRAIAALRSLRAEVERLRAEAREEYARAQQAETALVAMKAEATRLWEQVGRLEGEATFWATR